MTAPAFKPGQAVIIAPRSYPLVRWRGVIKRRTPNGYSVVYDAWGMAFRATFALSELSAA